jgi:hypothetical protein
VPENPIEGRKETVEPLRDGLGSLWANVGFALPRGPWYTIRPMRRVFDQRLKITDVQALLNAHAQLEAVIQALRTTNWAGGRTAIAALAPVDQWVVDLYNRSERAWLRYLQASGELGDQGVPADRTDQAAAEPTPDSNQSESRE